MVQYPFATWDEMRNATPGQDMGNVPKNLARGAKDALCNCYRNYPEWTSAVVDPVYSIMNIPLLEDLCRNNRRNLQTEIPSSATGGQCAVNYYARVRFWGTGFGTPPPAFDTGWRLATENALRGPITTTVRDTTGGGQTSREIFATTALGQKIRVGLEGGRNTITAHAVEYYRVDGLPDTCGNPPIPPVRVPPVGDIYVPTPIPTPNGPVIVPIIVPVGVLVKPTFQLNIGAVNINIDLGGVYLTPAPDAPKTNPRGTDPNPVQPPGGPIVVRPPVDDPDDNDGKPIPPATDLTPVLNELEKVKSYTRRPKTSSATEIVAFGGSGTYDLPERATFVKLKVVEAPPNIRSQSGGLLGPTVYHQGWCAFGKSKEYGERIPISYEENAFPVPVGCDSFSWTLYDGGQAEVSAIIEVDLTECETYVCG